MNSSVPALILSILVGIAANLLTFPLTLRLQSWWASTSAARRVRRIEKLKKQLASLEPSKPGMVTQPTGADVFPVVKGRNVETGTAKYTIGDKIAEENVPWPDVLVGLEYLTTQAERFRPHLILGILRGGVIVGGFISRRLQKEGDVRNFRTFWRDRESKLRVNFDDIVLPSEPLRILVVDDTIGTGQHMIPALQETRKRFAAADVKTMVLVQLKYRRVTGEAHYADYRAFDSDNILLKLPWDASSKSVV
jgi:hypoxanthine phosphoribosyltransferase